MLKKLLFKEMLVVLVVVYILNTLALRYDWYWAIREFDSLVHFLGGAWAVMLTLWAYFFSGFFEPSNRSFKNFLLVGFLGLALIAVVWEIFELVSGSTFVGEQEYTFDTALDFIMDYLGGIAAILYAHMREISSLTPVEVKGTPPDNLPV